MNCYKCATPLPDNSRFCFSCGADVSGEVHVHEQTLAVDPDPELMMKLQADVGTEYVIEKELGRGGMAIVFLGHDAHLGRKVAVKMLPPELTFGAGPSVIERFKREARTSATLDHPNIIPVYRVSQGQKLFWYVMKYLDGEALDDILEREGQLAVDRCAEILGQIADALDYAHQHQVIHRDIKPANIMVDARGRVTVTDFGIAKALDANTLTATGSMIGTPYFMSPEQCSGKRVAPASDQYSLAVMAYLMLGGHLPFTGDSVVDIIRKHVMDPVPPLGVLRPQLPAALVKVVERGLAKSPEQRFASCAEFAKALGQAAQGVAVTAAPPGKAPSGKRLSKTELVSPVPGVLRTAKSSKGAWIGGGVAVGVAVLAVALVINGNRATTDGRPDSTVIPSGTQLATGTPAPVAPSDTSRAPAVDTAGAPPAASPTPVSATPPAAAAPQAARLTLVGAPPGATITRDGRRVPSSRMDLDPGRRHIIEVRQAGFFPWTDTIRPSAGEQLRRTVALRPSVTAPATPTAAAPQPAARDSGSISLVTNPAASTIFVNGQPRDGSRLINYRVVAGRVTLRFEGVDSLGAWFAESAVDVAPGEAKRLGSITLTLRRRT